jgi:ATP-dependent RNA helicase RhlE|tara:strand:- start:2702 stop:3988 length:1287 start_codon:yes stop_codon:yes gene_type:complete
MSFNKLGLSPALLKAIQGQGYTKPSEIQKEAIPEILKGNDILAGAQTGTGKTAAFALPLLHMLQNAESKRRRVRVLVLVPTRELASQVGESFRDYGSNLRFKTSTLYGGVSINTQIDKIKKGVDIVVATPGRLLDHLNQKTLNLSELETFVLDEADRMLDMGFIRDIKKILKYLPKKKQNLLFSATFPNEIKSLADSLLNSPKRIQVKSNNSTADKVKQVIYPVDKSRKRELLVHCIKEENWFQVLVFSRTKHGANKLTQQLNKEGIDADALHGNKSQAQRTRALKDFKDLKTQVLVATDIAARGIDISLLPHVVNFDLPYVPEDYIHRIGRTARAGQEGEAISLVSADEHKLLFDIEKLLKSSIPRETITGFEPIQNLSTDAPKSKGMPRRKQKSHGRPIKKGSPNFKSSWNKRRNKSKSSKNNRRS